MILLKNQTHVKSIKPMQSEDGDIMPLLSNCVGEINDKQSSLGAKRVDMVQSTEPQIHLINKKFIDARLILTKMKTLSHLM